MEKFEHNTFNKRLKSMLKVDFRRMFTMPLLYIMVGACFVIPILILVMTTMAGGAPKDGQESVQAADMFTNTWQIIGTVSGEGGSVEMAGSAGAVGDDAAAAMAMDMTSMCNINLLYFGAAILVCVFISEDFRSGYSKNLFTVRAKKGDYVASKILVCFSGTALMLTAFFIGAMLGGAIAGLPFDLGELGVDNIVMCMLSKILLMAIFVAIYVTVGVAAKHRTWLSILGSLVVGMFMFMVIPMVTPLNSGIMNVILCLAGGVLFSIGLGAVSNVILRKTSLV